MPVYIETQTVTLPYPGLRPFRRDEFEIFFGREEHIAKLAMMLQSHHFVAVVGPSGCGKSSLVTAGLLPQLAAGHLIDIEGPWYEATIRPGESPFSRLAGALIESGVLCHHATDDAASRIGFLDSTLRRGPLGLIQALDEAEPLREGNLLIVVDQFEEIFRFRQEKSDQEADAFIAMLLETINQAERRSLPLYFMLTMRSDYLGDCNQFSGLPEAISDSQFLTPRPNREQRHAAIVGPAAMFGGEVEPALVNRMLNDMGDDPDQLPIMQHALMRMWALKSVGAKHEHGNPDSEFASVQDDQPVVLTTELYDEVGGWHNTLSNHADEAFAGLGDDPERQRVAKMMFRSLTQRGPNKNDVRRPVSVQEIAAVAGVATQILKEVANEFRSFDRCFLTPGLVEGDTQHNELADDDMLDISHESLIRQWTRLREWAREEGDSAEDFCRLEDAARRWKSRNNRCLQSPELDIMLKRYKNEKWTPVWARRYGSDFELAMQYLKESQIEKQRLDAEAEAHRNELAKERARADQSNRHFWTLATIAMLLMAATVAIGVFWAQAKKEAALAKAQAEDARKKMEFAERKVKEANVDAANAEEEAKIARENAKDAEFTAEEARRLLIVKNAELINAKKNAEKYAEAERAKQAKLLLQGFEAKAVAESTVEATAEIKEKSEFAAILWNAQNKVVQQRAGELEHLPQ